VLEPHYTVLVAASDGSLTSSMNLTIDVMNVNDVPVITNLPDTINVSESQTTTSAIFNVIAFDPDLDNVTFSSRSYPSGSPFTVSANGEIDLCKNWK